MVSWLVNYYQAGRLIEQPSMDATIDDSEDAELKKD